LVLHPNTLPHLRGGINIRREGGDPPFSQNQLHALARFLFPKNNRPAALDATIPLFPKQNPATPAACKPLTIV